MLHNKYFWLLVLPSTIIWTRLNKHKFEITLKWKLFDFQSPKGIMGIFCCFQFRFRNFSFIIHHLDLSSGLKDFRLIIVALGSWDDHELILINLSICILLFSHAICKVKGILSDIVSKVKVKAQTNRILLQELIANLYKCGQSIDGLCNSLLSKISQSN